MLDNRSLQLWVERVSLEWFGRPFLHQATFNARLKATGGRYFTRSHHIEISPHQLEAFGADETEKIIKHELCHYHLHLMNRGYRHRDADFKELLARVGGSRYCSSLPDGAGRRVIPYRYMLICQSCGMEYKRKKRVDPARYACGRCRGKLTILTLDKDMAP
ncbi:SprT family protein [Paenibacillus sp. PL2-23]|uniref:SprT family protein n=1 Tax=Paenibacillus sp. PL2-23 TaxID=2100729 RepID=UPI0030FCE781